LSANLPFSSTAAFGRHVERCDECGGQESVWASSTLVAMQRFCRYQIDSLDEGKKFLNGTLTSNIVIDTIDYIATANLDTSTKTVIIEAATRYWHADAQMQHCRKSSGHGRCTFTSIL
jgi:hypothetical protein